MFLTIKSLRIFFLLFIFLNPILNSQENYLISSSDKIEETVESTYTEINRIQQILMQLQKKHQTLEKTWLTFHSSKDVSLSKLNRKVSDSTIKIFPKLEELNQQAQKIIKIQYRWQQKLNQIKEQIQNLNQKICTKVIEYRKKRVELQQQESLIFQQYRKRIKQDSFKSELSQKILKELFEFKHQLLLSQKVLLKKVLFQKELLKELETKLQHILTMCHQQKASLNIFIEFLQQEQRYLLDFALFQKDLMQISQFLKQVNKNQKHFKSLEKAIFENIDHYSKTREELELLVTNVFGIKQQEVPQKASTQQNTPNSQTLFTIPVTQK